MLQGRMVEMDIEWITVMLVVDEWERPEAVHGLDIWVGRGGRGSCVQRVT